MVVHGFDLLVDPGSTYSFSFDAYISPETNIPATGTTYIANGEQGFSAAFHYDNSGKGTWQHFEYTGQPTSRLARLLLYPTNGTAPANIGYILYKNVEFKKVGSISNLFPQPTTNEGFTTRGNGVMSGRVSYTYSYDYSQNMAYSLHGFDIPVDTSATYTYSLDAYISEDSNVPGSGTTIVASGEQGFPVIFSYDNTEKGTWQHFEFTGNPRSNIARLLLYPSGETSPATSGFVLFRDVEFKVSGKEWTDSISFDEGLVNYFDKNGRLVKVFKRGSKVPSINLIYDTNGNVVSKRGIY
jgi:hypothetical protein